ncbi:hypothetical protein FKM82_014702 [Ascaphus truei]
MNQNVIQMCNGENIQNLKLDADCTRRSSKTVSRSCSGNTIGANYIEITSVSGHSHPVCTLPRYSHPRCNRGNTKIAETLVLLLGQ